MAYQYSNPYQASSQVNTPPASRSTFGAAVGAAQGYQVLFGGLPLDVTDKDLRVSHRVVTILASIAAAPAAAICCTALGMQQWALLLT